MAKRKEEPEMIPPREYAERAGAKYQTVMLWLRQNLIPGAQKYTLPTGGHYYLVPAEAPKPQTQRGPKPKKVRIKIGAKMRSTKKGAQPLLFEPPPPSAKPNASAKKPAAKKAKKGAAK